MRHTGRARADEIRSLHEAGWTLREIGDRYGITAERVRQILHQAGVPPRGTGETRRLRARLAIEGREDAIVRRFRELGDERAVAREFDLPVQAIVRLVRERLPHRSLYRPARRALTPRYSDDDIRSCVRSAAAEQAGALRLSDYARIARGRTLPDGRPWPSPSTVASRFRWTELLAEEGIPVNVSRGGPPPSYSRLACVESVAALWHELGRPPTAAAYSRWSAGKRVPSVTVVRRRIGSWQQVLIAAEQLVARADAS